VARLREAGAIPLAVTNTSELTLAIESANHLYGRTNNPYDRSRTAGGSSGGEGAAVGSGGAPFGLASDIAGSIRIPAFFCGVFGHKPSRGLVPNTGLWPPSTGSSGRLLGTGPLTRRGEDLMPLLRIIAGPDGEDPSAEMIALGDPAAVDIGRLTVTTIEGTARLPMVPEVRDARERAVGALVAAGATLRRVRLPTWRHAVLPYLATLQAASAGPDARSTAELLEQAGESAPSWRSLLRRGYRHTVTTRLALALDMLPEPDDASRQRRLLADGERLAAELVEAIGDGVLLHPVHPRPAPRHGRTVGRPWLLTPAAVFNLAGVPVTEVPLGLTAMGLPVGVQVAAPRGADHLSIAVALELERVFGGWRPPPR
jgi:fatty acid amide hydrolase 2